MFMCVRVRAAGAMGPTCQRWRCARERSSNSFDKHAIYIESNAALEAQNPHQPDDNGINHLSSPSIMMLCIILVNTASGLVILCAKIEHENVNII
jgi:hypothetical protein